MTNHKVIVNFYAGVSVAGTLLALQLMSFYRRSLTRDLNRMREIADGVEQY
jgi:hypothetical protein